MCGIIGRWNKQKLIDKDLFNLMRDTMTHRGPDGYGSYFSNDMMLALGHRRLSFLDLSISGKQPICNENETIWLTINGEIYNYIELKNELVNLGHTFKSNTDSEVILHGYEEWGVQIIEKLNGMFAFGLWDVTKQKLFLARDRFGIKPLYYYKDNSQFVFASEIKAIIEDKSITREIDYSSVCDYFYYRYVPSPKSIFKNIFKLEPGHFLEISAPDNITKTKYYSFSPENIKIKTKDAVEIIDKLLFDSVKKHIRTDVPIGSFLSGGYDSSAIVKFFTQNKPGFNTFSIGFSEWENSEHTFAEQVSNIYKTNQYSEILNSSSLEVLPELLFYYDEPIADISIIPTFFVSKLASKYNKAVLSGEGADELFAGYYWHHKYLWPITKKEYVNSKRWGWKLPINNNNIESYSTVMEMGLFDKSELKLLLNDDLHAYIPEDESWFYNQHFDETLPMPKRFQMLDLKTFMPELVLTKVDRASMANSLEVRVPFLENNMADFMLSLSPETYFDIKQQKILLYKILKKDLPKKILNRKKQGFVGPDEYYKNIKFYSEILKNSTLVKNNVFNQSYLQKLISTSDYWRLWKICIFELWYQKWMQ